MAGIMEQIFGAFKPGTAPQPQQPQVQNQPQVTNNVMTNPPPAGTAQTPNTAPNGVVPADGATPPNTEANKSPLEPFKELWQPVKLEEGQKPPEVQQIDPAKLMEAAAKVDFGKVITQEELAKIQAGGQEAATALVGILTKTSQAVYGQSMVATSRIVDQAVTQATERFASQLPDVIKKQTAGFSLREENPGFNDPAVAPLVSMVTEQFAQKYPKATPGELNKMAKDYLAGAAGVLSPQKSDTSQPNKAKEEDWSDYLK